jgi:hypothetical protein
MFNGKFHYKWSIFHSYVSLPKGNYGYMCTYVWNCTPSGNCMFAAATSPSSLQKFFWTKKGGSHPSDWTWWLSSDVENPLSLTWNLPSGTWKWMKMGFYHGKLWLCHSTYWKWPFTPLIYPLMVIFNSYVRWPEGNKYSPLLLMMANLGSMLNTINT